MTACPLNVALSKQAAHLILHFYNLTELLLGRDFLRPDNISRSSNDKLIRNIYYQHVYNLLTTFNISLQ